jgi:hypothetical protein
MAAAPHEVLTSGAAAPVVIEHQVRHYHLRLVAKEILLMTEHRVSVLAGLGVLALLMSCAPAPPPNPTAPPVGATVQAAGTQISGAAGAAATAVQTGVVQPVGTAVQAGAATQVAPTVAAAQTQVAPAAAAAQTQVAPTVAAAQTQVVAPTREAAVTNVVVAGATAQSAATDVSAMRQATATALAPTAQAVATRVAPTVSAAGTQVVGSVGTSVAQSTVHVTNVIVNPTDTTIAIQNSGSSPVNLAGWTLVVGPNMSVLLSDILLAPGMTRTLHFSEGIDTQSDVFMGFGANVASVSLSPGSHVLLIQPPPDSTIASVYSVT